jgi:hypothetical protein
MSIDQLIEKLYAERKLNPPQELSEECKARHEKKWREFAEAQARENSWWRPLVSYFLQVFVGFWVFVFLACLGRFLLPAAGLLLHAAQQILPGLLHILWNVYFIVGAFLIFVASLKRDAEKRRKEDNHFEE